MLANQKIHLTVVNKIVIGFVSLSLLLLVTSGLSYLGLSDIKTSAQKVAFEQMPIQQAVSEVNNTVLNLARLTTNSYYANDRDQLLSLKAEFEDLQQRYVNKTAVLSGLVADKQSLALAIENGQSYLNASQAMFELKLAKLETDNMINEAGSRALNHTDEASALMLDLSYLESDSRDLEALVGMTTNIDNKLGAMLGVIKTLLRELESEQVDILADDLDFSISNIIVDLDYAKRLAANINDDGIIASFEKEFGLAQNALQGDNEVYSLKRSQIVLQEQANAQRILANEAINNAIFELKTLSTSANKNALEGQENILSAVQSNVVKSLLASVFGIIATVSLAFIATRSIAKPLRTINSRLSVLSSGDLRKTLNEDGNDEFSQLARNLNTLIESLRSLIGSINEKADNLRQVTMSSISLGDESLEKVGQQQSQIDLTSDNTLKVKQTSISTLKVIKQADNKIEEAILQSERVVALASQSVAQVNEQAIQAKKSEEIINRLGVNSQKIGSILDVIKTIAEQTNLLALNAAIEAARAGEQGRGFAVVADEVRTLATRTHDSTEEIEKMIANLQADSSKAVLAMNEGIEQVHKGVEISQEVTLQVNQIKSVIESLALVNTSIVKDTQMQDNLLDDVVSRLNTIVELSHQSASSTQQSNEATHKIEAQMDALREAVGQFKLH